VVRKKGQSICYCYSSIAIDFNNFCTAMNSNECEERDIHLVTYYFNSVLLIISSNRYFYYDTYNNCCFHYYQDVLLDVRQCGQFYVECMQHLFRISRIQKLLKDRLRPVRITATFYDRQQCFCSVCCYTAAAAVRYVSLALFLTYT